MLKRLAPFVAILLVFAMTSSVDAAQSSRRKAEEPPPPPPPQFRVDVATKVVALARIGNAVPVGSVIGKYSNDACTIFNQRSEPVYSDNAFRGVPDSDFVNVFNAEAVAAGYRLAQQTGGSLFDTQESKAELVIGAGILAIKADGCNENIILTTRYRATMTTTLTVDWQVFDPLEKKIVFRRTIEGTAQVKVPDSARTVAMEGARAAFRETAKIVLADPNFVNALKDPKGGPPPSNDLFPEASAPPTAAAPSPILQIARVPPSNIEFRDQVSTIRDRVVTIVTPGGAGSGFYVDKDLILTNHHVIAGYRDVKVRFFGGREIAGQILASDVRRDVAMLTTDVQGFQGLPLRLDTPAVASQVYVIGSPAGQEREGTVTSGIVSAMRSTDEGPMIQSDVAITFGNSGGPMFDAQGNVIGISVAIFAPTGAQIGINHFIPIADALKTLNLDPSLPPGSGPVMVDAPSAASSAAAK